MKVLSLFTSILFSSLCPVRLFIPELMRFFTLNLPIFATFPSSHLHHQLSLTTKQQHSSSFSAPHVVIAWNRHCSVSLPSCCHDEFAALATTRSFKALVQSQGRWPTALPSLPTYRNFHLSLRFSSSTGLSVVFTGFHGAQASLEALNRRWPFTQHFSLASSW